MPIFRLVCSVVAAALISPVILEARAQSSPQQADSAAVLRVAQKLFDAMRTKDTAGMRDVFEPGARLVGMRTRPSGEIVLQVIPWQDFATAMVRDTRGEWRERAWSPEVRIRGTLATVWAEYDFRFGGTPSHCGVDAVQLLRTTTGWKIVSIADTYETTGCPKRPSE